MSPRPAPTAPVAATCFLLAALGGTAFWVLRSPVGRRALPGEELPAPPVAGAAPAPGPGREGLPRLALVIDDVGADATLVDRLAAIGVPVTVAVLPGLAHSVEAARQARAQGFTVLLHLPMEPEGYPAVDPGPGAILSGMGAAQIAAQLDWALGWAPGASGANNHMGSLSSRDPALAALLMQELSRRDLAFLDSRTTPDSRLFEAARRQGVPTLRRDVFLDDPDDPLGPRARLLEAVEVARRRGYAVAIGHGRTPTLQVLLEDLPRLGSDGVRLVPLAELLQGDAPAAGRGDGSRPPQGGS